MPPRNAPLPNAVNLFNCAICDKGYPRQTDYENHLRSYDHNHRQRLADMKKLTDANAADAPRPSKPSKSIFDMRTLPQADASNKSLGPRFKKIAGSAAAATGGSRFKKIGEPTDAQPEVKKEEVQAKKEAEVRMGTDIAKNEASLEQDEVLPSIEVPVDAGADEDVVMADDELEEDEPVTWDEYDVTRPSDCDHASCLGCAALVDPVYENGWLVMGSA